MATPALEWTDLHCMVCDAHLTNPHGGDGDDYDLCYECKDAILDGFKVLYRQYPTYSLNLLKNHFNVKIGPVS